MIIIEALKSLIKKPFTIKYPKGEKKSPPELFRGKHIFIQEKCIGCGLCEKNCHSNCIKVNKEEKKITIRLDTCTFCGLCRDVCPTKAIIFSKEYEMASKDKKDLIVK